MAYIWWLMMKMWSILHVLEKNCYKLCAIVLVAEKWADVLLIRLIACKRGPKGPY